MRCKRILIFVATLPVLSTTATSAEQLKACGLDISAIVSVDQGHPWRPPFGLERVGAQPVAHVELTATEAPTYEYYLIAYRDGQESERHILSFQRNPSLYPAAASSAHTFFAHASLASPPSEVILHAQCDGREELVRQSVDWPLIEVDAVARPDRHINPVDLGAILPPHDWLLLVGGQTAIVDVAAYSHVRDLPNTRLRAWFDQAKPVEVSIPLTRNRRVMAELKLPVTEEGERTTLHIALSDGERDLWQEDIQTMVVAKAPRWPSFGAEETKLRYDAPIVTVDSKTGGKLAPIDYDAAWDPKFKDVVVFLPNGSRFVFWRGANYIPFWAGNHNTGVLYQWAENCSETMRVSHPDGTRDCPEPLFDSELRYGRVRVLESSASRVHVRWEYQLTDVRYEIWGGAAREDFYFYPDGFGTRVLTLPSVPGSAYQLSEFIILTPQAAYPFEVLPRYLVEALPLEGKKERLEFPFAQAIDDAPKERGFNPPSLVEPHHKPMIYRLFAHKDDTASAIYFHPTDPAVPWAFPPFFDQGEIVTPVYWGNHWPLNRGKWTGWGINDQITATPAHNSVAGWSPRRDSKTGQFSDNWEVAPMTSGEVIIPDARGQVQKMNMSRFAWMIAYTDLPDEPLREWGRSFSIPPTIKVAGARLDIPSYIPERRAFALIAERSAITIRLEPTERTVNPVFEIDEAPGELAGIALDGEILANDAYAWDGSVLWINTTIGPPGSTISVRFR